jgi:nucleoporin NDC1
MKVGSMTADPNVTLISGITSTDSFFLHFAYAELRDVATDDSAASAARRAALFSDQKFSPSLWSTLAREALLRLGQDYQTFLRRGKPAPPAAVPVSAAAPKNPDPPSTPLLRQAIYKAPRQSPISKVLDSFASDSQPTKATDTAATQVETRAKDVVPIPELFRSVSAPSAVTAAPVVVPTQQPVASSSIIVARVKQECGGLVVKYSPPWSREVAARWHEWWTRDRINKVAETCLPNRELDVLIIQGMLKSNF